MIQQVINMWHEILQFAKTRRRIQPSVVPVVRSVAKKMSIKDEQFTSQKLSL